MKRRLSTLVMVLIASNAIAKEKQEYLIPEDWDKDNAVAVAPVSFEFNESQLISGLKRYSAEQKDCSDIYVSEKSVFESKKVIFRNAKFSGPGDIDIYSYLDGKGKVIRVKFDGRETNRKDDRMLSMVCLTYAVMRVTETKSSSPKYSAGQSVHLWELASQKTFEMTNFSTRLKAGFVPFQLEVFQ